MKYGVFLNSFVGLSAKHKTSTQDTTKAVQKFWKTNRVKKGFAKSLPPEEKKKKYKLHLKSEESTLIKLLQPFYNIEPDTRGCRHWKDNEKYSGYRDTD